MDQASFTDPLLDQPVSPAEADVLTAPGEDTVSIDTRYGAMSFDRAAALGMIRAMPGFPGLTDFALGNLPDPRFGQFKLLQSLDEPEVSFLVTPVPVENPVIAIEDAEQMLKDLGVEKENAALLLIVTVRKDTEGVALTVNARAPVVVDTEHRKAAQYVMRSETYSIQHPIELQ